MAFGKRKRDSIHETPDVSYITNPDVAHEHSDVSVRPLLWFVAGLTVFTAAMALAMYLMFLFFQDREQAAELRPSPLARQGEDRLPPEPRLQLAPGFEVRTEDGRRVPLSYDPDSPVERAPRPQSEYWEVREEWRRKLHGYGWVDQNAGTVRVPVEEAMRRYAERQKGKHGAGPATPGGEQIPSPQSSGQQPEQRHQ
jgi:Ca2+/H+ antiporter